MPTLQAEVYIVFDKNITPSGKFCCGSAITLPSTGVITDFCLNRAKNGLTNYCL